MISAFSFLTVLGPGTDPDARTLRWFPAVGATIGGLLALVWWGLAALFPPMVAAAIVVAVDLGVTGMLHFDGLADSADGLLPPSDRQRRLDIMRRPDVGAFAVAVCGVALLARWASLATETFAPVALVAVWAISRTIAAAVPAHVRYARPDGLASAFVAGSSRLLVLWIVPAVVLLGLAEGVAGLAAAITGVTAAIAVVALAVRRVGGYTGDVLGALIVVAETAALVTLTAAR